MSFKYAILFFLASLPLIANHEARAVDQAVQVKSLYAQKSWLPNFYLPFRVVDGSVVSSVYAETDAGPNICKTAKDPFYPDTVLLRCSTTANVYLNIATTKDGKASNLRFGPIAVAKISGVTQVDPAPPTDVELGSALFKTKCASCHPSGSGGPLGNAISTDSLQATLKSLGTGSPMPAYISLIPADDVAKIAAYLRSL